MTKETKQLYRKVYAEAYEIVQLLEPEDLSKIPENIIDNLEKYRDKDHDFEIDLSKPLEEQDFLPATKMFYLQLYKKYLAPEEDKEVWEKFDKIVDYSYQKILQEKNNPDNLFKDNVKEDKEIIENVQVEEKQNINDSIDNEETISTNSEVEENDVKSEGENQETGETNNLQMIKYKAGSIFSRIVEKIKGLFNKKDVS